MILNIEFFIISECFSSCWAFAAAGALDANLKIRLNVNVQTSQQELVDCSGQYGTLGCNGGHVWDGNFSVW